MSDRRRFDDVVMTYRTRVEAAGGSLTPTQCHAYNRFVKNAKRNAYWDKLLDCGTLDGGNLTAALVKLKVYSGSGNSLTNTGFASGDFSSNGITGKAACNLSTGINYTSLSSGLGGLVFFQQNTQGSASQYWYMGVGNGSSPQMTIEWNNGGKGIYNRWGGSNIISSVRYDQSGNAGTIGPALIHVERSSTTALKTYLNGGLHSNVSTSTTLSTRSATIQVLAASNALHAVGVTCGFYAVTDGTFSDTDAANLAKDVLRLQRALGRMTYAKTGPLRYVPVIGQSLARGAQGTPVVSTSQSYKNLMFSTANLGGNPANADPTVWTTTACIAPGGLTLLTENSLETISSGFANHLAAKYRAAVASSDLWDTLHGNFGVGATAYSGLAKGTNPYNNSVNVISRLLSSAPGYSDSETIVTPAILCVHGESDMSNASYDSNIRQWQSDYETDIKALTGQTGTIPMFCWQPSCWTAAANVNLATGISPYKILSEFEANPTKIIPVGAGYFMPHDADGVHRDTGTEYAWMGEYTAKAFYQHVVQGIQWYPLYPTSIVRVGATITVSFAGRVGNLVLDTTNVSDPGNYGFEWSQTGGTARTISSVALGGSNTQVIITLIGDPGSPSAQRLRYAYTGTAGNSGGPTTGPRGCLRDSDPEIGTTTGRNLYNWCLHFDKAVS